MRQVDFDPAKLTDPALKQWWQDWQAEADAATSKVVQAWEKWLQANPRLKEFARDFQQSVWKDLKVWMLEQVFHFKCAYCESPLELDRYHGDAEHYRPKGQVTIVGSRGTKQRARCMLPDGTEIDHPGYFWLAYNWRNLVPACSFCNTGQGKIDQFPTGKSHYLLRKLTPAEKAAALDEPRESPKGSGTYFLVPWTLDAEEEPLLLNPLNTDPQRAPGKHLRYGLGGKVVAIDGSPIGENSIRVYNLNRGQLEKLRHKAQETIHRTYYATLIDPGADFQARLKQALQPYVAGQEDFSSAALDYLREMQRIQMAATVLPGD